MRRLDAAIAIAVTVTAASPARGGAAIVPLEQARSVHAFLIVPPCQAELFDDQAATTFDPFDESVDLFAGCDFAQADAAASQQSAIGARQVTAAGVAASYAEGAPGVVIHAIANSIFDLTFELTAAEVLTLDGTIASGATVTETAALAGVVVTLFDAKGQPLYEVAIEPGPDGEQQTFELDESLALARGVYRLRVSAASLIDHQMPPGRSGEATYDVRLAVGAACPADVNGDGAVDVEDLVAVILAWGTDDPAADVDGSGAVDVNDLVQVVLAWGGCP